MIVDALLDVIFGAAEWIVTLFPEVTVDLSDLSALTGSLVWLGYVFDMAALTTVIGLAVAAEVSMMVAKTALFVWRLTPLSG